MMLYVMNLRTDIKGRLSRDILIRLALSNDR
jgi:hypothetical protein